jgi:hypothetical protein
VEGTKQFVQPFYGTICLFHWFIFRVPCDWNGVAVLWRMHHILQVHVMLRLPDECIIFCVLLFNECVLMLLWHDYLSITNYNIWQFSHSQPYGKLMDQWNVLIVWPRWPLPAPTPLPLAPPASSCYHIQHLTYAISMCVCVYHIRRGCQWYAFP